MYTTGILEGSEFYHVPSSAEDGLKIKVSVPEDKPKMHKGMYYVSAKSVVLENCQSEVGL